MAVRLLCNSSRCCYLGPTAATDSLVKERIRYSSSQAVSGTVNARRFVRLNHFSQQQKKCIFPQQFSFATFVTRRHFVLGVPACSEIVQFHLSDIGEGIKEVTIKEWFVAPGDRVAQFDQICEVQSDKASVTITSRFDGIVKKLHYRVDDIAQTGDPLVDIEVQGTAQGTSEVDVQENEAIQVSSAPSSSPSTSVSPEGDKRVLATPAVRRLATQHNLQLAQISGTGKDGRVMKEDILLHIEQLEVMKAPPASGPKAPPVAAAAPVSVASTSQAVTARKMMVLQDQEVNFTGFTRAMTKSMTAALLIPHFLYCDEIDMTELAALRKKLNAKSSVKVSFMPFLVKAASLALSDFPILNSSIDVAREKIIMKANHNIGVAMDTPDGLIVPNIKGVQNLSILEIAQELLRLQDLGQRSKLGGRDLKEGTITLSNIGSIGGTYAKPVIMSPEVCIGALGKIQLLPRFDERGELCKAQVMNVSWSADHRVIDGATMARFSNKWKECLETPATMILHLR